MLHLILRPYAALLLAAACVQFSSPASIQTCEHQTVSLDCGSQVIRVVTANYGRTDKDVCSAGHPTGKTDCVLPKTLPEMAKRCDGRNKCTVSVSNEVFSDPCPGIFKYLEVSYVCVPKRSSLVCEGQIAALSCGTDWIKVIDANYGRRDICPCSAGHPARQLGNLNCIQPSTLQKMASSCDGKSSCAVSAINSVFTDPCVGTYKYLEVNYMCVPPIRSTVACEGQVAHLACDHGVIMVQHVNYGRLNRGICSHGHPEVYVKNTSCSRFSPIVAKSCNSKTKCSISANNSVFGDPCRGTYKYLDVKYYCV